MSCHPIEVQSVAVRDVCPILLCVVKARHGTMVCAASPGWGTSRLLTAHSVAAGSRMQGALQAALLSGSVFSCTRLLYAPMCCCSSCTIYKVLLRLPFYNQARLHLATFRPTTGRSLVPVDTAAAFVAAAVYTVVQ